ncbi:MAG: hypothetical protein AAF735_08700, partial [Myxococcota bacterium]
VSFAAPSPGMTETLSESSRSFVGSFFGSSSGSAGASAGISLSLSPAAQTFVGNLLVSAGTGVLGSVGSAGLGELDGLGGDGGGADEPRRRRRRVAAGYHDELRSAEQVHRDNKFFLDMTNQERLVTGGVGLVAAAAGACAFVCGPYAVSVATNIAAGGGPLAPAATAFLNRFGPSASRVLQQASTAANRAAAGIGNWIPKAKHLLGGGSQSKARFLTDNFGQVRSLVQEALRSPNANFLPNPNIPNTFRVVTDMGRAVGQNGRQFIRVVVGMDGKVINAFPTHGF